MSISPDQVKTARRLLGWSVPVLAGKSGLSVATISNFEKGTRRPSVLNVTTIRKIFEDAGIEFGVEEPGANYGRRNEHETDPDARRAYRSHYGMA
jgi:transcriptional regulator with XRE-family HTH domain